MKFLQTNIFQFFMLSVFIPFILPGGESRACTQDAVSEEAVKVMQDLTDKALSEHQQLLLTMAFQTASKIPLKPNIKDRSRAQEAVVQACLKLHQPQRALKYTWQIKNWRRGSCLADIAFYCAEQGIRPPIEPLLQDARQAAEESEDWRRDRVRIKAAQTYVLLGMAEQSDALQEGVAPSEMGKTDQVRAAHSSKDAFAAQLDNVDTLTATGNFDVIKNALYACVELYDRFYEDQKQRGLAEEKMKSSWGPMPIFIRVELLQELAERSLNHNDDGQARKLIHEAEGFIAQHQWPLENYIPMTARLAALRARAGNKEQAFTDLESALAFYQENKKQIVNIYRADTLLPLAESFQALSNTAAALSVYQLAVEEGMENPNSRPRAEDLSATCVSMALYDVQPSNKFWGRIDEIYEGLSDPW